MSQTSLIIAREFNERVRKKSFIITTILMPLFMVAMMALPALIMLWSDSTTSRTLYVVDPDCVVGPQLVLEQSDGSDNLRYILTSQPLDSLLGSGDADGVLVIPSGLIAKDMPLKLYLDDSSSLTLETAITSAVESIVENERLKAYDIANLKEILQEVKPDLTLQTSRADSDKEQSAMISYFLGLALTFVLYMFLLLYGQMVMNSIIEEKNNRVLEIVVSSVSPTKLMLGKIAGIGLVAVTQILIWAVLVVAFSSMLLPMILPESVAGEVAAINSGALNVADASLDSDLVTAISIFSDTSGVASLFAILTLFLVLGFLFYSSIFAAIGSAVDNVQDASQLTSIAMVPIMIGMIFGVVASAEPTSPLAFWGSLIPFTSPMMMMARVPYGIPAWEIALSAALLAGGVALMVWIAAKIYRVGIFMYGKKPNLKELVRWARYK